MSEPQPGTSDATTPASAAPAPSQPPSQPPAKQAEGQKVTFEKILDVLKSVEDPEIHQNIVGLGLIYGADISESGDKINLKMTLTTPYCPYGPQLIQETKMCLLALPNVKEAVVDLIWEPPWDPKTMASNEVKDALGMW